MTEKPNSKPIIAFYAPLKAPDHPVPSGDRQIARLLMQALQKTGYQVQLASRFRSLDIGGDDKRQKRLQILGRKLAYRLISHYNKQAVDLRPSFWFTYHLYHKAPDWLGPVVSKALDIPYLVVEASYAPKQKHGPWHRGLQSSRRALLGAARVFCINPQDKACITALLPAGHVIELKPFLGPESFFMTTPDRQQIAEKWSLNSRYCWLICVAMMRPGDKTHSYNLLAQALRHLKQQDWQLLIIGDGNAAETIIKAFDGLDGVRFLGQKHVAEIRPLLAACDLLVWPAVNEALGLALLEAQACGTAVLTCNEGGVASVVQNRYSGVLTKPRDVSTFAAALDDLITDRPTLESMGKNARHYAEQYHSLSSAGDVLKRVIDDLVLHQP